jgi:hypothetical protein
MRRLSPNPGLTSKAISSPNAEAAAIQSLPVI